MSSLFFAIPASATEITLQEAQAALALAHQEVLDATAAVELATEAVATATVTRDTAQIAYNEALTAWEATKVTHPGTSSTTSQNVVVNGTFDDASAWSNIGMGSLNNTIVNSSIPRVYNGVLIGSYIYSTYVQQVGTFPSSTRQVTFSYDMSNNNFNDGNRPQADQYRVEFRTYNAAGQRLNYYDTRDRADVFGWTHFEATYTLTDDAVRWDIGFRLSDSGFWNGNFAGSIDNIRLVATMGTTTPETYTYGQAETAAKASAYDALQAAQSSLTNAILAKTQAETRLSTALSEVSRLEALVVELTPHLNAPTGLTAVINGENVDLSWTAPESNLSGVQVERYAIMWSTTSFLENGWAWAHDQTSVSVPLSVLASAGGLGNTFQFSIRADNDTQAIYSSRSNIVSIATEAPPWWQLSFGEGETVSIATPEGYKFGQPRAWYGSPSDTTCGQDVSDIVNELINGRTAATFSADNGVFGDPCGGVVKVLRLSTPVDQIVVAPTPTPTQEPTPSPQPTPTPTETPVIIVPVPEPTPEETVEPTPEPTVEPTIPPTEEPTPTPSPSEEPVEEPTENVVDPTPEPEPSETPEPEPEPELPVTEEEAVSEIENLVETAPEDLTDAQVEQLVEAAMVVFETAEQGSPEYEQALEALAVAAEADDSELPSELAAIPLLGDVAGAALEVFNNLGNVGADMAPEVREEAEKTVIATVIAAGAAINAVQSATAAATSAAATASGSSGTTGGSSGGSSSGSSARRKE